MIGRQTVKALVTNYDGQKGSYVACCNSINSDIMIHRRFVPPNINLIAKWVSVVVQGIEACDLVQIIDDLFETRVVNGRVQVKAEATRVANKTHLYHQSSSAPSFFGFIYDHDDLISMMNGPDYYLWVTPWEEANSRWKVSGVQEVVVSAGGRVHRTMEGIIFLDSGDNFIAWSKSNPEKEIVVGYGKCPRRISMLGAWISMTVDENNCVVDTVTRINDLYRTIARDDVVEVNTDFDCISKNGEPVFYNSYFGYICDATQVFRNNPKVGSRYNAWIANVRFPSTNERWRLADNPTICEQQPAQTSDQYGHSYQERPKSTRDYNREDYYSSSRSGYNFDSRRNGFRSPTPRSRIPPPRADTFEYESVDSDEEFMGIAPCVSHKPNNEEKQEFTLSQQEYRDDNSFSAPEIKQAEDAEPIQKLFSAHNSLVAPQDDLDNRDKRPKKQRTPAELEKLKLQWELFTMSQSLTALSKHKQVVEVCKKTELESYDTAMALRNAKH